MGSHKKARGRTAQLGPEGRAVCFYLSARSGSAKSVLASMGMPSAPTTGVTSLDIMVGIGCAIDEAVAAEEKLTGRPVAESRLLKRWKAYLKMAEFRNRIPEARHRAEVAIHKLERGYGSVEEVADAEERLLQIRDQYHKFSKENDRLRKGSDYLVISGAFLDGLKKRAISV